MMRILTILLLPLLFIATSCDSGGEGTACSIDASGKWMFEEFNILDLSSGCECYDFSLDEEGTIIGCDQVGLKEALEDIFECANIRFTSQLIFSFCDSKNEEGVCSDTICNRGECDCQISYERSDNDCSDNFITNPATGMVFAFTNDELTGGTQEQSIQEFLEKYILWDDWNSKITGSECSVQTEIQFVR